MVRSLYGLIASRWNQNSNMTRWLSIHGKRFWIQKSPLLIFKSNQELDFVCLFLPWNPKLSAIYLCRLSTSLSFRARSHNPPDTLKTSKQFFTFDNHLISMSEQLTGSTSIKTCCLGLSRDQTAISGASIKQDSAGHKKFRLRVNARNFKST